MTDIARRQWREATHAWRLTHRRREEYAHRLEILRGYATALRTWRLRDERGVDVCGDLARRVEECDRALQLATATIGALVVRYSRGRMPGGFAAWAAYFDSAVWRPTDGLLAPLAE